MSEVEVLNAKEAIAKHVNWRLVLQFAIAMEEQLTPEQVSAIHHHRECAIGRWLETVNYTVRQHPTYHDLVRSHIQFHREMIAISELIETKCFVEAKFLMRADSGFGRASAALAAAITALSLVSNMAVPFHAWTLAPAGF